MSFNAQINVIIIITVVIIGIILRLKPFIYVIFNDCMYVLYAPMNRLVSYIMTLYKVSNKFSNNLR